METISFVTWKNVHKKFHFPKSIKKHLCDNHKIGQLMSCLTYNLMEEAIQYIERLVAKQHS